MAFKMKGWSPFDKKEKKTSMYKKENKTSMYKKEEKTSMYKKDKAKTTMYKTDGVNMDEVYKALDKSGKLQDTGGFSARELAAMTEKERAGNINDYTPGSFDKMVQEMKKELSK